MNNLELRETIMVFLVVILFIAGLGALVIINISQNTQMEMDDEVDYKIAYNDCMNRLVNIYQMMETKNTINSNDAMPCNIFYNTNEENSLCYELK